MSSMTVTFSLAPITFTLSPPVIAVAAITALAYDAALIVLGMTLVRRLRRSELSGRDAAGRPRLVLVRD